jgi:hypothetical protein|nr:MAG TPA: hypothetical protein [Caudoviricetes sp.]
MEELTLNSFNVQIEKDGSMQDCTEQVPYPLKWSNLLDEQLDEGSLSVLRSPTKIFPPLTKVRITLWNESDSQNPIIFNFFVASDAAEETPPGSGKYNHTLYLIEETKFLEGFICRSQGYVNSLGRIYTDNAHYIEPNEADS